MPIKFKTNIISFGLILVLVFIVGCKDHSAKGKTVVETSTSADKRDLGEILKSNKLTIIAENSALSYFIYKGQKMGLEYEILNAFAKEIGVKLEVKIIDNLDDIVDQLNQLEGDIIACNYTVTKKRRKKVDFTIPHLSSSQVLIQRKPENWQTLKAAELEKELIRSPEQLSRKSVHVWKESSYYDRLVNLQGELGDTIVILPLGGNVIPEKAIEMVSKGFIDYTILDENAAKINKRFYPNIDAELAISIKQKIAFAVRKKSPLLRKKLDEWLEEYMESRAYKYIIHKYLNLTDYAAKSKSEFSSIKGKSISPFDNTIKTIANKHNWDWRLIAAVIYQESKFIDNLESWAGAYGLMQFMPSVGPVYGVYPDSPIDVQIDGGVRKINRNFNDWKKVKDSVQRLKFTLATYNAGLGHIYDAQRLAEKYGKDPLIWDDNVEIYIRKLSDPEYYRSPEARNGFMHGEQTYNYVRETMARFNEYKSAFPK